MEVHRNITTSKPRLTGANVSTVVPVSPDAKVSIAFLSAAIVSDADWNTVTVIDGHVNIVEDKFISEDDVRQSDADGN